MKIGNTYFNVDELKKLTLTQARKLKIPHIEEAWRVANKKPIKK